MTTIATVDATVLTDIYRNERSGTEVSEDLAQIAGAHDLLRAVSADSAAATLTAIKRIVYHPVWHIVRLRVLDASGRLLADLGGPYVIAPVTGVLRSGGRVIGSFVMSVQDDAGVTKLESDVVGNPIAIYVGGKLATERRASFPRAAPGAASIELSGTSYRAVTERYSAFPSGTLDAVLLIPPASASRSKQPCASVRAGEFGRVAVRLAQLASSLREHYSDYAGTVRNYTGTEVFIRDGADQLATTAGAGPAVLPTGGTASYDGMNWLVFSFEALPAVRVYLLIPPD